MELNDVSMNCDIYAVACSDGRIVVGCENVAIMQIRDIKEGNKIWKNHNFIKVKWLDSYHLAASSIDSKFYDVSMGKNEGKIYIFDVR